MMLRSKVASVRGLIFVCENRQRGASDCSGRRRRDHRGFGSEFDRRGDFATIGTRQHFSGRFIDGGSLRGIGFAWGELA